ncbi:hypothetical protein IAR50_000989 [Cryptococcus sp. DSM 104548]
MGNRVSSSRRHSPSTSPSPLSTDNSCRYQESDIDVSQVATAPTRDQIGSRPYVQTSGGRIELSTSPSGAPLLPSIHVAHNHLVGLSTMHSPTVLTAGQLKVEVLRSSNNSSHTKHYATAATISLEETLGSRTAGAHYAVKETILAPPVPTIAYPYQHNVPKSNVYSACSNSPKKSPRKRSINRPSGFRCSPSVNNVSNTVPTSAQSNVIIATADAVKDKINYIPISATSVPTPEPVPTTPSARTPTGLRPLRLLQTRVTDPHRRAPLPRITLPNTQTNPARHILTEKDYHTVPAEHAAKEQRGYIGYILPPNGYEAEIGDYGAVESREDAYGATATAVEGPASTIADEEKSASTLEHDPSPEQSSPAEETTAPSEAEGVKSAPSHRSSTSQLSLNSDASPVSSPSTPEMLSSSMHRLNNNTISHTSTPSTISLGQYSTAPQTPVLITPMNEHATQVDIARSPSLSEVEESSLLGSGWNGVRSQTWPSDLSINDVVEDVSLDKHLQPFGGYFPWTVAPPPVPSFDATVTKERLSGHGSYATGTSSAIATDSQRSSYEEEMVTADTTFEPVPNPAPSPAKLGPVKYGCVRLAPGEGRFAGRSRMLEIFDDEEEETEWSGSDETEENGESNVGSNPLTSPPSTSKTAWGGSYVSPARFKTSSSPFPAADIAIEEEHYRKAKGRLMPKLMSMFKKKKGTSKNTVRSPSPLYQAPATLLRKSYCRCLMM